MGETKEKNERLHEYIEHIEDSLHTDNINIFFTGEIDKFMKAGEKEYFADKLQQMFRHLRRNCSWFFEVQSDEETEA